VSKTWTWRRLTWWAPVSWILHGGIHYAGQLAMEWAAFSPAQTAVLLTLGFLGWFAREEGQGWGIDGVMDLAGPALVTARAWWLVL
jgi:hypothetical protein